MKCLFLLFSPFQMLNAIEARHSVQHPEDECYLIYCKGISETNAAQIRELIDPAAWKAVHYIPDAESRMTLAVRIKKLENIWAQIGPIDRFFVGHFGFELGRHLNWKFKPKEVWILDDGTASHRIYEYRFESVVPSGGQERKGRLISYFKRCAYRFCFGLNAQPYSALTFFSIYRHRMHDCDKWVENKFQFLRSGMFASKVDNEFHFLGGCQVELGILSNKFYESALRTIIKARGTSKFIYFAHRRESNQRLQDLSATLNIEIRRLDVPYEMFILRAASIPGHICSLYSSALDSCALLLAGINVDISAYRIPSDQIHGSEQREFIDAVYNYYASPDGNGVRVRELAM